MEIVRREQPGFVELAVEGRLDGYWAQHLANAIDEVVRQGCHRIRLDFAAVSYVSSAGMRVLIQGYQQLSGVEGWLAVGNPSAEVRQVLEMAGLSVLLAEPGATEAPEAAPAVERREIGGVAYEFYGGAPGRLICRAFGSPGRLAEAAYGAEDSRTLKIGPEGFSLGLGAFGTTFESCRDRFGEFLGVAGAVACQPTDGTNFPDYMVASGSFLPSVTALYGLACEGQFGRTVRFETGTDAVGLSRVLDACIEDAGDFGMVLVAESAGLMGAALKKPPLGGDTGGGIFDHPEVRRWLSFSPQRAFARSLAVAAGVVSRTHRPELAPWLRPVAKSSPLWAHLHAAAFGYRPLQKGNIEMNATVRGLFDSGGLKGVLHLLADDREIAGGGESEFLRGACWIAPIAEFIPGEAAR
jgi:anti-anti-sigma factor